MNQKSPGKSLARSLLLTVLALAACAVPRSAASQALEAQVGAYELSVLVDGAPVRTYAHAGETHVLGQAGSRYVLRVHNRSARRIEAVVSVDGLDVIDGKPADFIGKRGYLVPAYGYVDIEGWRLSEREAAAFRFGAVSESYAAKTGSARNVGVIGVAVFPERIVRPRPRLYVPAPSSSPRERDDAPAKGYGGLGGSARSRGAASEHEAPATSAPAAPSARAEASSDMAQQSVERRASAERSRPGLGTEFGEAVSSSIQHVAFVRESARRPAAILGARYDDRDGLIALGIDVDGEGDVALRQSAHPFPVSRRGYATPPTDWRRF